MKLFPCVVGCLLLTACGRQAADQSGAETTTNAVPAPAVAPATPSADMSYASFGISPPLPGLKGALQTVTTDYLVIQVDLAADSVTHVPAAAAEMKEAVAGDKGKTFDADFAKEVDNLAAATDLHTTRIAFQPLSATLIAVLAKNHVQTGALYSAFCPMVKASWLQTDGKTIHNPYMGSVMPDCGSFQKQY